MHNGACMYVHQCTESSLVLVMAWRLVGVKAITRTSDDLLLDLSFVAVVNKSEWNINQIQIDRHPPAPPHINHILVQSRMISWSYLYVIFGRVLHLLPPCVGVGDIPLRCALSPQTTWCSPRVTPAAWDYLVRFRAHNPNLVKILLRIWLWSDQGGNFAHDTTAELWPARPIRILKKSRIFQLWTHKPFNSWYEMGPIAPVNTTKPVL